MVNMLRESKQLENRLNFSRPAAAAVLTYLHFCELGAVSPDYPYLAVGDKASAKWADTMHWIRVGDVLKRGVAAVKELSGEDRKKGFAWLLGYAAHVATDTTIHPVVELKVGPYPTNQRAHRVCEMNQDAYIWQRMNLGDVGLSEHLKSGLSRCAEKGRVDNAVKSVWESMLSTIHPDEFAANRPQFDKWHGAFDLMVNKIGEEGNRLMPLARHVFVGCGLTYPLASEVDPQYILNLAAPGGKTVSYDELFDHAIESVSKVWIALEGAVYRDDAAALEWIGNWNLDSGKDEAGNYAFWA